MSTCTQLLSTTVCCRLCSFTLSDKDLTPVFQQNTFLSSCRSPTLMHFSSSSPYCVQSGSILLNGFWLFVRLWNKACCKVVRFLPWYQHSVESLNYRVWRGLGLVSGIPHCFPGEAAWSPLVIPGPTTVVMSAAVVAAFQEIAAPKAHGKGWWGEVWETVNPHHDLLP